MLRELTEYYRPTEIAEALALLARPGTVVALAGGTELLARRDATTHTVVDLQALGLDYLRRDDDGLHIGAMTRLQTLITDAAARMSLDDAILQGVMRSASYTERCAATAGGTVASAPAWNDVLPSLLALDASVLVQRADGRHTATVDDVLGNRGAVLMKGTLITEVFVPSQPSGARFACVRVSRTPADRAIVNVAVRAVLHDGLAREVRIAVGGAASCAMRLREVEASLKGADFGRAETLEIAAQQAMDAVQPPADHIASSAYRREMAGVLVKRAFLNVKGKDA
jgi:probable selenate reductase FAD-binding subunit